MITDNTLVDTVDESQQETPEVLPEIISSTETRCVIDARDKFKRFVFVDVIRQDDEVVSETIQGEPLGYGDCLVSALPPVGSRWVEPVWDWEAYAFRETATDDEIAAARPPVDGSIVRLAAANQTLQAHLLRLAAIDMENDDLLRVQPLCRAWVAGETYAPGEPLIYNEQMYVLATEDKLIAQAHQPPDADGMLAVYRPIVSAHKGTKNDPIPYVYGMDCKTGKYYVDDQGATWKCTGDMTPCVWPPGSVGVWQWELADGAKAK